MSDYSSLYNIGKFPSFGGISYDDSFEKFSTLINESSKSGTTFSSPIISTYSLIYTAADSYWGGVLAPNGDIHFVPYWICPVGQKISSKGIVSTYTLAYTTTNGAYRGGVLDSNGNIHFIPNYARVGQKISNQGVISTYSIVYTGGSNYRGGVLSLDGYIHYIPESARLGQKISPSGVASTYSLAFTTADAYYGGVLAPNGDIHFVPFDSPIGQKISASGVCSTYSLKYTGTARYKGGVLSADGKYIHFCPYTAGYGQKVNTETNEVYTYSLLDSRFYIFTGGVLSPDGYIYFLPDHAPIGQRVDVNGVVSTYSITYTELFSGGYHGGILDQYGNVHMVPYDSSVGIKISFLPSKPFSHSICCSPFFNKF